MTNKAKLIAQQNDVFRQNITKKVSPDCPIQGKYVFTQGIKTIDIFNRFEIILKVQEFNDFNENNDPHEEHDLGKFNHNGHDILWKIDYYDPDYLYGSEDPSDPSKTKRVLTTMLACEY